MNRRIAVLALLLAGGCHHDSGTSTTAHQARAAPSASYSAPQSSPAQSVASTPPAQSGGMRSATYPTTSSEVRTTTSAEAVPSSQYGATQPATAASSRAPAPQPAQPAEDVVQRPLSNIPACQGLSDAEITRPVIELATETRSLTRHVGKQRTLVSNGALVRVPAERGHNQAYVQRVLTCQSAQALATGSDASPLAVEGTRTRVTSRRGAYEIRLTNPTPELAREIERRVEATVPATAR